MELDVQLLFTQSLDGFVWGVYHGIPPNPLISHLKDTTSLVYLLFLWDKGQFDVLISSDLWLQAVCVVSAVDKSSKTTRRRPADHGHAPALCPFGPWVAKGSGLSMVGVVPMICEFSEQQYIAVMNGGLHPDWCWAPPCTLGGKTSLFTVDIGLLNTAMPASLWWHRLCAGVMQANRKIS
jgi:hypothetical protein